MTWRSSCSLSVQRQTHSSNFYIFDTVLGGLHILRKTSMFFLPCIYQGPHGHIFPLSLLPKNPLFQLPNTTLKSFFLKDGEDVSRRGPIHPTPVQSGEGDACHRKA